MDLVYKASPGIIDLEQESFITHTDDLYLNLGFPSLHFLPGPASPNLSAPRFPVQTNFQSFSRKETKSWGNPVKT